MPVLPPDAPSPPSRTCAATLRASCSCDLLLTLGTHEAVGELLGEAGVSPGALLSARDALHDVIGPEPADWRVRLAGRGAISNDLDQLLAICRSADGHAYQLLEQLGANCASLRKAVIERLRVQASERRPAVPPNIRPPAATMARARRAPSASPRAGAASVRTPRPQPERPAMPATVPRFIRAGVRRSTAEAASAGAPRRAAPSEPAPVPATLTHAHNQARAGLQPLDPQTLPELHGRERELQRLADALSRRTVRAPLLVGPPGSGRSVLTAHLATALRTPVYRLAATAYDEDGQDLAADLTEIANAGGIAVLDDLDRVPSEAPPAFLGALAHAFNTGSPPVLTVVSPEGHGRLCTWLPGAMESADALVIGPLRGPALEAAVKAAAPTVLELHGIGLGPDAKLGELTRLSERYLTGIAMPARALDLLDLAAARTARAGKRAIERQTWLEIVAERSGLPPERIEVRGDQEMLELEQRLASRVVGHDDVIGVLASLVRRNRAGFGGQRPTLSALLLGPSGVGKTEIAKALSEALFERDDALVRLDMSEYSEAHAVARIVGAPPGYVGHEQGGALSDPLLARPHCVVLLDEIEKAHRDVHQLLLQVFDEGRLTDGRGRTVDFRHAAIIMTSNLGSDRFARGRVASLDEAAVLETARAAFPLELWNRIEAPLVMQPLSASELGRICRRLAQTSSDRLFRERGIRYRVRDDVCDHLVSLAGRDPSLGARPLRHLVIREVESTLADAILRGHVRAGVEVEVALDHGRVVLA